MGKVAGMEDVATQQGAASRRDGMEAEEINVQRGLDGVLPGKQKAFAYSRVEGTKIK